MFSKLACFGLALAAVGARADGDLQGLCKSGGVEGSYIASMGPSHDNVRINIICLTDDRAIGSFAMIDADRVIPGASIAASASFSHATVDGDQLILSDFPVNNSDRPGHSSKGLVSYVRLNIAALKIHEIRGTYMRGNRTGFGELIGQLDQPLPRFAELSAMTASSAIGVYAVSKSQFGPEKIIMDILGDTPVIYISPNDGGESLHLVDGPQWDGSGNFTSATPEGNGGEPDDRKLFVIRGHFVNASQFQFYLISAVKIEGPLTAVRTKDFQGEDLTPEVPAQP